MDRRSRSGRPNLGRSLWNPRYDYQREDPKRWGASGHKSNVLYKVGTFSKRIWKVKLLGASELRGRRGNIVYGCKTIKIVMEIMWPANQSCFHHSFIFIEINFYSLSFLCDIWNEVHEQIQ